MTAISKAVGIIASMIIATAATVMPVSAQGTSSGVRISPTRAEITVEQGGAAEASFNIKNITGGPIIVTAELNDFEPTDDGSPKPLSEGQTNAASIRNFITLPGDIELGIEQSIDITIPINISETQAPGAYYGVVLFKGVPRGGVDDGQVSLAGSVGGIILVNVPGEVSESMQLVSVRAGRLTPGTGSEIRLSNVFAQPFDRVQIRVNNTGNSFLKPFGKVTITDWRNREVSSFEMNDINPRANVLPQSQRVFTNSISGVKMPGRYTIVAGITYGSGGDVLTQKINVWYLPVWLVAVVVAVLALIVFAAVKFINRRGRR